MRTLSDTWTLARRSLRHITRSPDTVITVLLMPIALMLLFVYVWGGAMGQQTGSISYIDFIVPGIVVMTVISGISYAAIRLNMDVQSGIINRFRTMPVAPSSILGGQVASSTLSNLFSSVLVLLVAFAIGFRSQAGVTGVAGLCRRSCCCSRCRRRGWPSSSACLPRRWRGPAPSATSCSCSSSSVPHSCRRLHDTVAARLCRESADDSGGRDDAFAVGQRHGRPQGLDGREHGSSAFSWSRIFCPWRSTSAKRSW